MNLDPQTRIALDDVRECVIALLREGISPEATVRALLILAATVIKNGDLPAQEAARAFTNVVTSPRFKEKNHAQ